MNNESYESAIRRAASAVRSASTIVVAAGAGMSVDSGLPDFRGDKGFWNAYPAYGQLGLNFSQLANPAWFRKDPALAWGFYGHRMNLYRDTVPHAGHSILRKWMRRPDHRGIVFTSNVDGAFVKSGFSPSDVVEHHGSIHHVQCVDRCGLGVVPADDLVVTVDPVSFRAVGDLPACPGCGGLLRPNIIMFNDFSFDFSRADDDETRLNAWLQSAPLGVVVVEIGAGSSIPSVRNFSEKLTRATGGTLVRINLREPECPSSWDVGIARAGLEALQDIDSLL